MTSVEVLRVLKRLGFAERRQTSAHVRLVHPERPACNVTLSVHQGKDIKPGTLASILRQAGVSREEFDKARRK